MHLLALFLLLTHVLTGSSIALLVPQSDTIALRYQQKPYRPTQRDP